MLKDYLGDAATNVTLEVTENGMGGDKQYSSLAGGLFYADSIGQILQTEFNSRLWWDMRNGANSLSDSDPAFYGWRTDGSGNFISDAGIVSGLGGGYPTYYVGKLMPRFAAEGDTVVSATSDYPLLAVYSVKRMNGNLTLLVINKSSSSSLPAAINLSGYLPDTNATVYSYGIPQDTAAETGVGSPDIAQSELAGVHGGFSVGFAPFSVTVMVLNAAPAPALAVLPVPSGKFGFQLQGQSSARYLLQYSTNLTSWTSWSTNTLSGSTANFTNSISASQEFWRALWLP
jgi:hypothetical protein